MIFSGQNIFFVGKNWNKSSKAPKAKKANEAVFVDNQNKINFTPNQAKAKKSQHFQCLLRK